MCNCYGDIFCNILCRKTCCCSARRSEEKVRQSKLDSNPKPSIIFVIGPPKSGCKTVCTQLAKSNPNIVYLDVKELADRAVTTCCTFRNDDGFKCYNARFPNARSKNIVPWDDPSDAYCGLIRREIEAIEYKDKLFVVTGFPRYESDLNSWYKFLYPYDCCPLAVSKGAKTMSQLCDLKLMVI